MGRGEGGGGVCARVQGCVCVCRCVSKHVCMHIRYENPLQANRWVGGGVRVLSFFFQDSQLFSCGIIGGGRFGVRKGSVVCRPPL